MLARPPAEEPPWRMPLVAAPCCAPVTILDPDDLRAAGLPFSGSGSLVDPFVLPGWNLSAEGQSFALILHDPLHSYVLRDAVVEEGGRAGAAHVVAARIAIEGLTARGQGNVGLFVQAEDASLRRIHIEGHGIGLHVMGSNVSVDGADLSEFRQFGILANGRGLDVANVTLHSGSPSATGMELRSVDDAAVRHADVRAPVSCLTIRGSRNHVLLNAFEACRYGVVLQPESDGNLVASNAFGPGVGALDAAPGNRWDNGARGNFWADHAPADGARLIGPHGQDHAPLGTPPCDAGRERPPGPCQETPS